MSNNSITYEQIEEAREKMLNIDARSNTLIISQSMYNEFLLDTYGNLPKNELKKLTKDCDVATKVYLQRFSNLSKAIAKAKK